MKIEASEVLSAILDSACPSYDGMLSSEYIIETHCVSWKVFAKKTFEGWVIVAYEKIEEIT